MTTNSTSSPVYFLNDTWHCKKKCLSENHETIFIEEGGYTSEAEAYIAYGKSLDAFNRRIEVLKTAQEQESSFLQHLIRWYHNILMPRSDSSTKTQLMNSIICAKCQIVLLSTK